MKTENRGSVAGCGGRMMVTLLVAVGGIYLLFPELRPQIVDTLPLVLLLCPLMHLFCKGINKIATDNRFYPYPISVSLADQPIRLPLRTVIPSRLTRSPAQL